MKIGVLKEEKVPADKRVPLTPKQCRVLLNTYPNLEIAVKSSDIRCFSDEMYRNEGIAIVDDVSDCDVLIGVKEVPKTSLIANKTYFYFSHTVKKQEYNRDLLIKLMENPDTIDFGGEIIPQSINNHKTVSYQYEGYCIMQPCRLL